MQAETALTLPEPDPASEAHSQAVRAAIVDRIRSAGGFIPVAEFMQLALYAPELGYYVAGNRKFGAGGDFVTAPEVSGLFGRVIARQVAPSLRAMDRPRVLEFGAGSGKLAADVMSALDAFDALPAQYCILEVSPELVERQRRLVADRLPRLAARFTWLSDWPDEFSGVVLANEVLDAMPVERFRITDGAPTRLGVTLDGGVFCLEGRPAPGWLAADIAQLEAGLERPFAAGYESEAAPAASAWIRELADHVDQALILFFDYGLPRREYYAPERGGGWLRCHFRHRAHNDPLVLPGIQDITSWVDFTRIAEAGVAAGLAIAGYLPQAQFLLEGGLLDELAAVEPAVAPALSREIKLLTLPGEMGEHFKCLGLTKGGRIAPPPDFTRADQSHRL